MGCPHGLSTWTIQTFRLLGGETTGKTGVLRPGEDAFALVLARLWILAPPCSVLRHEDAVCYTGMRWCCGAYPQIGPPTLTAEQLAEKKREEAELIAAQLAKPSYWDEVALTSPTPRRSRRPWPTPCWSTRRGWRGSPTRVAYCRGARTCRAARG